MESIMVRLQINPEYLDVFIEEIMEHARLSVGDPGCLLYDVVQDQEDPNLLYVYEVFVDEVAHEAHRNAPYNTKWRDTVKDWHPADWIRYRDCFTVFPPDSEWHK